MYRRVISILISFALTFSISPVSQAFADDYVAVSSMSMFGETPVTHVVVKSNANQETAYNRIIEDILDYENSKHTDYVTTYIGDLKLSDADYRYIRLRLRVEGKTCYITKPKEASYKSGYFFTPLKYDFNKTKLMQEKLNKQVTTIVKKVRSSGVKTTKSKINLVIKILKNKIKHKSGGYDAYDALVSGKGNCMACTQAFNLICQELGIETSFAWSCSMIHVWSVANVDGSWKHYDIRWGLSGNNSNYYCKSDKEFVRLRHNGWVCQHRCNSLSTMSLQSIPVELHGKNYYKMLSNNYCSFHKTKNEASNNIAIPNSFKNKSGSRTYRVVGISKNAFKNTKAKTLTIKAKELYKSKTKGCLKNSNISTVIVVNCIDELKQSYKTIFNKSWCGKKVKLKFIKR